MYGLSKRRNAREVLIFLSYVELLRTVTSTAEKVIYDRLLGSFVFLPIAYSNLPTRWPARPYT